MTSKTAQKLRDAEYRKSFVASQVNIGIPFQLRALLRSRGKSQEWLAEKAVMRQPRISALLTPGKTRPNIETLRRLAEAFDCALEVRFIPFSELVERSERFDPESFSVPSFDEEMNKGAFEELPATVSSVAVRYASGPAMVRPFSTPARRPPASAELAKVISRFNELATANMDASGKRSVKPRSERGYLEGQNINPAQHYWATVLNPEPGLTMRTAEVQPSVA
jgi:transcriptional regulator with XRE-family HTH domain